MRKKCPPDTELVAAQFSATTGALRVLVRCLEDAGALPPDRYPEALRIYMENSRDQHDDMTLALLHEIRGTFTE